MKLTEETIKYLELNEPHAVFLDGELIDIMYRISDTKVQDSDREEFTFRDYLNGENNAQVFPKHQIKQPESLQK